MSDNLPVFTNEADAWRWLAKQYEDRNELVRGLCDATSAMYYDGQLSHLRTDQMYDRLQLLKPGPNLYGYWWDDPRQCGHGREERALACCLLATLAEEVERY